MMRFSLVDDILTIYLEGRIEASNAPEVESEILKIRSENVSEKLNFDLEKLEYVSSSGLRIFLKFAKSEKNKVCLINVNSAVYEVLEMTGFVELLEVKKALRKISTENLEVIGQGGYGKIYRLSDDSILKTFLGFSSTAEIENGIRNAKKAFIKGIPTAIPFDVVKTEDGLGVVFELLNAKSLAATMHGSSDFEKYAKIYVDLGKLLATVEFDEGELPFANDIYLESSKRWEGILDDDVIEIYRKFVNLIPRKRTAVHGDFHARNMMLVGDDVMLIDMDDFCCGHPIWDCASVYDAYQVSLQHADEKTMLATLGFNIQETEKIFNFYREEYFNDLDESEKQKRLKAMSIHGVVRLIRVVMDRFPYGHPEDPLYESRKNQIAAMLQSVVPAYDFMKSVFDTWK